MLSSTQPTLMDFEEWKALSCTVISKIYKAGLPPVDVQAISKHKHLSSESFNAFLEREMRKSMAQYHAEEEEYVKQKLIENPVVCERRPSNRSGDDSSNQDPLKQKRAESCRRSRINNKIRKAKIKLQYMFAMKKLVHNATILDNIRQATSLLEQTLLSRGFPETKLKDVRDRIGFDRSKVDNLLAKISLSSQSE